jgi:hypothetical protein
LPQPIRSRVYDDIESIIEDRPQEVLPGARPSLNMSALVDEVTEALMELVRLEPPIHQLFA